MLPSDVEYRLGEELFTDISLPNIRFEEQSKISPHASENFTWDVYLDSEKPGNSIAITNDGYEAFDLHCIPSSKAEAEEIIDNAIVDDYHGE